MKALGLLLTLLTIAVTVAVTYIRPRHPRSIDRHRHYE
jgi:hypothetical protein